MIESLQAKLYRQPTETHKLVKPKENKENTKDVTPKQDVTPRKPVV